MSQELLTYIHGLSEFPWVPYYTQDNASMEEEKGKDSLLEYWALAATITFTVVVFTLEYYLNTRQKKAYTITEFPSELSVVVSKIDTELAKQKKKEKTDERRDEEKKDNEEKEDKPDRNEPLLPQLKSKFTKSQTYGMDKITFGMFSEFYGVTENTVFLLFGFLPYMWDTATKIGTQNPYYPVEGEIAISLIFLFITTVVGMVTSLPFELVSFFFNVKERKVIYDLCVSLSFLSCFLY